MKIIIPDKLKEEWINFVLLEKSGKKPFQAKWQTKNIKFDDEELLTHLKKGGNYGVMGGGEKQLVIVDFDKKEIQDKLINKLPETFTVKTGSGLLHKYFYSDNCQSFKIFDEELMTLLDVQGKGKQVVGAGSIHPNGNFYEVVEDKDIAFIPYAELQALIIPYDKKPKKEKKEWIKPKEYDHDNFLDIVKSKVSIEQILSSIGIDTAKNPCSCPFHDSKGGKCLGWQREVAHCFHCDNSWNIFSLVKDYNKCSFVDALEWICENNGLTDELKKSREEYKASQINEIEEEEKSIPSSSVLTKIGQAEEFCNRQPLFYDRAGMWWLWNKTRYFWELTDEIDILNIINKAIGVNIIKAQERVEIKNALMQVGRTKMPQPIQPTWIQFRDEIFDIETGETLKPTPEYFVTNPIPYRISKDKFMLTPIMDRIFEEWVGKAYVQTLYEIISYCMLPNYPLNRLFCFVGSGMNGKSKFLELLTKFIGEHNCTSTELDTLLTSRFEVTRLHKKLVCQMGETNFNEMSRTSMLKKLTGGDLIGYEYKNKTPFHDKNYAKILISTNSLPTTTDKTMGFYRRWMIIDFPNEFSEAKDILQEIPEEEYECLALKCCFILNDLLKNRRFHNEGTVEDRKERYEARSDFLQKFVEDFVEESVNEYITKADFYKKFISWCKENRHREMSETSLGLSMKKKGYESERKYVDWLHDGKGGQMRVWVGLKWKD